MDDVKEDESFPRQNTFADNGDYVYDTEDTDDDDSKYEFAPRAAVTPPVSKKSQGGRNSLTDWTEHETFALLEAWGERLLRHSRRCVRSEEWYEVAEKVSEVSKFKRTKTQCRNRLDTLKRKYKTEKIMFSENVGYSSNWVFFNKMDKIICTSLKPANGKSLRVCPNRVNSAEEMNQVENRKAHPNCSNSSVDTKDSLEGDSEFANGENDYLDDLPSKKMKMAKEDNLFSDSDFAKNESGKYQKNGKQIVNVEFHPNNANSLDGMQDSLVGDSDFEKTESDNAGEIPSKQTKMAKEDNLMTDSFVKRQSNILDDAPSKKRRMGKKTGREDPFKFLADCINKFSSVYEKVEKYKSEQLVEFERWRMDFQRDVDLEKRMILKRGQAEMAKIWGFDIKEDLSPPGVEDDDVLSVGMG